MFVFERGRTEVFVALHGALSVEEIVEDVGPALPAARGLRGRSAARLRGRLVLVPGAEDGSDEGEQLLHIIIELARQTRDAAPGLAPRTRPDLLRRPLVTTTHLRHQRLPEVNRLVPATTRVEAVRRRHRRLSAAALELSVLCKVRVRFHHRHW